MTAALVGMDWGMMALGIHSTPHKAREVIVRAKGLTTHYGEHAAVSTISFNERLGVIASVAESRTSGVFDRLGSLSANPVMQLGRASDSYIERPVRVDSTSAIPALYRRRINRDTTESLVWLLPDLKAASSRLQSLGTAEFVSDARHDRDREPPNAA